MKILYIYDDPNNHICTENWIEYALKQNGHEVTQIPQSQRPHDLATEHDIVLFSKVRDPDYPFVQFIETTSATTVCWLFDLYIGINSRFRRDISEPQFKADLVFTTDGGNELEWKTRGINHFTLRQGIHEPEHFLWDNEKEYDVAFVGNPSYYNYRRQLMKFLGRKDDITFQFTQDTYGIELNELLSKTKVVVGDSYPSENYWSNRVYEITGRGGFLIMPETEGLDEEFSYYDEIIPYERGNWSQLDDIIDHFVENDDKREEIRRNGFKKCGQYTYQDRCKTLIDKIKQHG